MNFKQLEHEHVAQSWERMKLMLRNCSTHGLNLLMKDPFSGTPNDDFASHLNTFVELCDMQKKKDVDHDIVKLKLFPFSLRDRAKKLVFFFASQ